MRLYPKSNVSLYLNLEDWYLQLIKENIVNINVRILVSILQFISLSYEMNNRQPSSLDHVYNNNILIHKFDQ